MIKFDSQIYQNKAKAISAKLQELYWKVQLAFFLLVLLGAFWPGLVLLFSWHFLAISGEHVLALSG